MTRPTRVRPEQLQSEFYLNGGEERDVVVPTLATGILQVAPDYTGYVPLFVDEGDEVTFELIVTGISDGTKIPWLIEAGEITLPDLEVGDPNSVISGYFTIVGGKGTVTFKTREDLTTEGDEKLQLTIWSHTEMEKIPPLLRGLTAYVVVKDTSVTPPSFILTANKTSCIEGESITFTLRSEHAPIGLSVPYRINGAGIDESDFAGAPELTGVFVLADGPEPNSGIATVTYNTREDFVYELGEEATLTLEGVGSYICPPEAIGLNVVFEILDRPYSPGFVLSVSPTIANETDNNTITFSLYAEDFDPATFPKVVPYVISGTSDADDFAAGTQFSGAFTLNYNDVPVSKTFKVIGDGKTEGDETLTMTLESHGTYVCPPEAVGLNATATIEDTSVAPPEYTISFVPGTVNETTDRTFDLVLTTVGVPNGTRVPFAMTGTGIALVDFEGLTSLEDVFVVSTAPAIPGTTIVTTKKTYTIATDDLKEDDEYLRATLQTVGLDICPPEAVGKFDTLKIEDTSRPYTFSEKMLGTDGAVTLSSISLDLSDSTVKHWFTEDGSPSHTGTPLIPEPIVDGQKIGSIVTQTLDGKRVVSPMVETSGVTASTSSFYKTNIFGSGKPGLNLNHSLTWNDYKNPVRIPFNNGGITFYYVGNSVPYFSPYHSVGYPTSRLIQLYQDNYNNVLLTLGKWSGQYTGTKASVSIPTGDQAFLMTSDPKVFCMSVDVAAMKVYYAMSNGVSQELDIPLSVQSTLLAWDFSNLCHGPEGLMAEYRLLPFVTSKSNLLTKVNELKLKWNI